MLLCCKAYIGLSGALIQRVTMADSLILLLWIDGYWIMRYFIESCISHHIQGQPQRLGE